MVIIYSKILIQLWETSRRNVRNIDNNIELQEEMVKNIHQNTKINIINF